MGSVPLEVWVIGGVAVAMAVIRFQVGISRRRAAGEVRFRHWARYTIVGMTVSGVLAVWLAVGLGRPVLVSWLVGTNVVAVAFYGWDKLAAYLAVARVPERSLHLMALAGGTIGAFVAQNVFHHKTKARPFQLRFWGVVALQAAVLAVYANTQSA